MQKKIGLLFIAAGVLLLIFTMNPMKTFSGIHFGFSIGTRGIDDEQTFDADDFRNLSIRTGSTDVQIVPGSSDQIKARLYGKVSAKNAEQVKLKTEQNGDTLELGVQLPEGINVGVNVLDVDLTVELPEKQWALAAIESGSGDIEIERIQGETVRVKAGSGDIDLRQAVARELTVHTGSGDMEVEEIEADILELESVSGDISAERYKASLLKFQEGSGDIELKQGESALQGQTSSGNIRLEAEQLLYDADLRAGSGNVTIDLDQEPSSLAVDFQGGSGSGKVRWDGMKNKESDEDGNRLKGTFGSGDVKLKVRTGSGDFTLE